MGLLLGSFIRYPGTWFGGALLIVALTWGGWNWTKAQYFKAELASTKSDLRKLKDANDVIAGQVRECNAAVHGLAVASAAAVARAGKALERATAENAKTAARQAVLHTLLTKSTPAGAGCKEGLGVVRKSLDEEMR